MIHDLGPYPAYKDSGVPWLGKVPEHWEVRKLKFAVSISGGGTPSKADPSFWNGQIPWVSPKDMKSPVICDAADHITEDAVNSSATKVVQPGAVLVVVRSGILRRSIPVAINSVPVAINQDMKALRPGPDLRGRYLRALIEGNVAVLIAEWTKQGATVESIEHELFSNSRIPIPPLPEQSAIVRFLDLAERRIQRYVRAKRKLIALVNEQKQAVIHRAVTRGLDPNVRLKPSGAEWLGDVPEHWEVVRLGRLIRLTTGFPFKSDGFSQSVGDIRLLRGINIAPGRVRWNIVVRWPTADREAFADFEVIPGDIVLGMDRPIVNGGMRVAYVTQDDVPALLLQRVARIRTLEGLETKFALLLLSGKRFSDYLAPIFTGISVPHVSPEQIGTFHLALPSKEEQGLIVGWVTHATDAINTAMATAHHEISLLREYSTRLISDVVTGKLDVREVATSLPEELEELEALDEEQAQQEDEEESGGEIEAAPEEPEEAES